MNYLTYFTGLFESFPDYKKIVSLIFSNKNDIDLITESGFLKSHNARLKLDFKNILSEQIDEYYSYVKYLEESIIARFLNKLMEQFFATMFEDVRHERSLKILLSLTAPDILRQTNFTDDELEIIKKILLLKNYIDKEY